MNSSSLDLKTAMLDRLGAEGPRKVWTPSEFVDLASRDAIDKALQRLTTAGTLKRIDEIASVALGHHSRFLRMT